MELGTKELQTICRVPMPLVLNQLLKYKLVREKVVEKLQLEH